MSRFALIWCLVSMIGTSSLGVCPAIAQVPVYLWHWGASGSSSGELAPDGLWGLAVDPNGALFVADSRNHRVQVYTVDGTLLRQWGSAGDGPGQFAFPWGIALDDLGNVYVSDSNNHRMQVFTREGVHLLTWDLPLPPDFDEGNSPRGVAVDKSGRVYVALETRVEVYTSSGGFLMRLGPNGLVPGKFNGALSLAVDEGGNIYVAEGFGCRIYVFQANGSVIGQWGGLGSGPAQFNQIFGITVGRDGMLYVADRYNFRIQMLTSAGTFIGQFGSEGEGPGQFLFPWALASDAEGRVFVSDPYSTRITVFGHLPTPTHRASWGRIKTL